MRRSLIITPLLLLSAAMVFAGAYVALLLRAPHNILRSQTASIGAATSSPQSPSASSTHEATTTSPQKITATLTPAKNTPQNTPAVAVQGTSSVLVHKPVISYSHPPLPLDSVNTASRSAVVNILCTMRNGGSLNAISGSGVVIDPRGVILTNAHVAQYVLLSESPRVDLACVARTDSPAVARWNVEVLYMPQVWVDQHASEINAEHPLGTGEHDYALLRIVSSTGNMALPSQFTSLPYDIRDGAVFLGDAVVGIGYPAEFLGSDTTLGRLYAVSSVSRVQQLLTFSTSTIDAVSIGGVMEAQGGSSGGAVVNAWQYLVGLITTTSSGATTSQRDLRALTLNYIDRDMFVQTGQSLQQYLAGDLVQKERDFNNTIAPHILDTYLHVLNGPQ